MRHTRLLLALAAVPLTVIACDNNEVTPPVESIDVAVTATGFQPPSLIVEPADSIAGSEGNGRPLTVRWEVSGGPHNVTFEAGASSPGSLPDGATFERDFSNAQAGTYRYRCTLHSTDFVTGEVGQIVVIQ